MLMKRENKVRLVVFICLQTVFMLWTFLITSSGLDDGPGHGVHVALATLGTVTGPLTGAISREFQGCCLEFSMSIMKYCAPTLALGIAAQFFCWPDRKWAHVMKLVLWTIGWLVWLGGGILSFAHALS